MALSRRNGQRFQSAIWPGFVDAMTGLLLVLMFVLTIFMIVQFVLRETITGQADRLDTLSAEVAALSRALGLEQDKSASLEDRVGVLSSTLSDANQRAEAQSALITSLQSERDTQAAALSAAATRIASFEEQVAGLLAQREGDLGTIAALEGARDTLLSEREQLQLALAGLRDEVDAQAEVARLAAAKRAALEALIADLKQQNTDAEQAQTALFAQVGALEDRLSEEEAARLAEAAAAQALRARLANATTELTAMTLALEAERARAEETLTLLAAADAARDDLDVALAAALLATQDRQGEIAALQSELADLGAQLGDQQGALNLAGQSEEALRAQLQQARDAIAERDLAIEALRASLSQSETALSTTVTDQSAERAALEAEISALREQLSARVAELDATKTRLAAALAQAQDLSLSQEDVRKALAAALAAKLAAEQEAATRLSEAEERAILLAQARAALADQEGANLAGLREQELLNQQVAALREQLGALQALLDDSKVREAVANVQMQTLGNDLNAALARVAAEEKRRRELEEEKTALLEAEKQNLEKYRSEFFGRLRDVLGAQDGVRIEGDRFVFSSEVLFAPGQATLSRAGQAEVAKVAAILRNVADEIPDEIDWVIRVDGHTDDVPIRNSPDFADNWELSQARALSVVRYMVDFLGIPPSRLAANGFGQYQPINPGNSQEARAQNRRIELKFTEK